MDVPFFSVQGITKAYAANVALKGVTTEFAAGEIHGVIGENGAGKSTLMAALSGFIRPDEGEAFLEGRPLPFGKPFLLKQLGIAMVHQHFTLVPALTVRENLALFRLEGLGHVLHANSLTREIFQLAQDLGWEINPEARAGELPVGVQQRIEILKALSADSKVLILDEPTAVLTPQEVLDLFRVLNSLRDAGKCIILIGHKLSEIIAVADRVTVLRRGQVVARLAIGETNETQLAELMVGEMPIQAPLAKAELGPPVCEAQHLVVLGQRGEIAVRGVTFKVLGGEIFGIGGVDGNGQIELAETLAGIRGPKSGSIETNCASAYIPQDRQNDGLALRMSVLNNLAITGHAKPQLTRGVFLSYRKLRQWAQELVNRFNISVSRLNSPASSLSGGNQQKIVVARALEQQPRLLIAANPTRGLDVAATHYVHQQILGAARGGAGVVLISTDLDELYALSRRVTFMSRGQFVEGTDALALVGSS